MEDEIKINLSDTYTPREYQRDIFDAIENLGKRFALLCWPRRAGKDVTLWHLLLRQALKNVGVYFYCLPTYSQGKTVIWQSIRNDGLRIVDMVPEDLIYKKNESNMSIELHNGSIIKLVGSDSYNKSNRGSNPKGIIFSEYAQADPEAFRVALSIVQNNNGFIIIQSTPFGHNDFYNLYKIALEDPQWFCQKLTVEDTKHIAVEDIQHMINTGVISYEFSRQEYYTDFNIGALGSFYGQYLIKARLDGRIGVVPYETHYHTYSVWDLGVSDSCAIIFFQVCEGGSIHIIDYYENNKLGLEHYCKYVLSKDYMYAQHFAPFDIGVQEFGTGITRLQLAQRMGIEFTVLPRAGLLDGIEAVRCTFSKFYINEATCERFISCMQNYSQEWDTKNNVYKPTPKHDAYSHGADCCRYLVNSLNLIEKESSAEDLQKRYLKAMAKTQGVPYTLNTYRYR